MGERHLRPAVSGLAGGFWRRWTVPVALLLSLVVLEVVRPAAAPVSARGAAHYLQAQSLLYDQDSRFDAEDLERLRRLPQSEELSVLLARDDDGRAVYPGRGPEALWLVPFVAIAGLSGAVVGSALAVALAMGLAATTMRQRLHTPWGLLLVALFASAAIAFLLEPRSEALLLAAVLAAFSIAHRGEASHFAEMPEVYDDALRLRGRRLGLRWSVVGALLAVVTLAHPVYLLLFIPAGLAVPVLARRSGVAWLAAGGLLTALLTLGLGGGLASTPWLRPTAVFSPASGFPDLGASWQVGHAVPSLLDAARPHLHLGLLGWNGVYVAVGQAVGVLPYFFPLILLLALWEPRGGRSPLVVAVATITLLVVIVWPFDWAGSPGTLGNALLLPAFGALWLTPTRPVKAVWLVPSVLIAGVFLWPTWLQLVGLRPGAAASERAVTPVAVRWLPLESTLRVPDDELVRQGRLALRVVGGAASRREGRVVVRGGEWADVLLVSESELPSVLLEFDGQAGSELEVTGGELGNTIFRGDGGVMFEVMLGDHARRHPMWWSRQEQTLYDLHLRLPKAPPFPVAFRVRTLDALEP